ncbi:MAG: alpha-ketoacid dehydrogenase subunit beta [Chloroflexi bacterium]|nr:alpha-ketoacid dehydrogenase subunit beta [Chloroflexota bacterium]
MPEKLFSQGIVEAQAHEMRTDPTIFVAGEDIELGGVFATAKGLREEFGSRVFNTPIAEAAMTGLAIGAAATGMRPIVEIMFMDFMTVAMDQVVNQMAKMRYMFGGETRLPLVLITHAGAGHQNAAQHSQSLEAWFCHVPGLKVVWPSDPYDGKGLMIAAIRDDNPVIYITNKLALGTRADVPDDAYTVPIGKAAVKREGEDVTVVAVGAMVPEAIKAADAVAERGLSVEVVDPRTLSPLDTDTIVRSVRKTGRAIVAHEAVQFCGYGAEVAAQIAQHAFDALDAPVLRVGAPFSPVPFNPNLEKAWLPGAEEIIASIEQLIPTGARA